MSVEVFYLLRKDEPEAGLQELDDVVLLIDVLADDGSRIESGTEGTVVAIWHDGSAYEVEFAVPEGALATVRAADVKRIGRAAA